MARDKREVDLSYMPVSGMIYKDKKEAQGMLKRCLPGHRILKVLNPALLRQGYRYCIGCNWDSM